MPEALFNLVGQVTETCFSPELLNRFQILSEFQPDYVKNIWLLEDVTDRAATVELGSVMVNGFMQHTFIDNVEHIGWGTKISAGAQIGAYCFIGNNVDIEAGADLSAGCHIAHGSIVQRKAMLGTGVTMLTGAKSGEQSVLQDGTEVNYDLSLDDLTVTKPNTVVYG